MRSAPSSGFNDLGGNRSASVEVWRNPHTPRPSGSIIQIERRNPPNQDAPSIRVAAHQDGHVYAAFMSWTLRGPSIAGVRAITMDVVVTRDDDGGLSGDPFGALLDPGDSVAGVRAATGLTNRFSAGPLLGGTDRIGSDLALAVDPTDSSTVDLAWCDDQTTPPATTPTHTLHLQRSTDQGATWSGDIFTLGNARNPGIAINDLGTVAFMY